MRFARWLAVGMLLGLSDGATAQEPKPLDKATVAAFEKRGFTAGWMGVDSRREQVVFAAESNGLRHAVFTLQSTSAAKSLKDLPACAAPFGLDLDGVRVTDEDLNSLAGVKNLVALNFMGARIPDAGRVSVPDGGLTAFAGLTHLTALSIGSNAVTKAGLKEIGGLKKLTVLSLKGNRLDDDWLMGLTDLANLEYLDVSFSRSVHDGGVKHLASLPNLATIRLSYTGVTGDGLKHFAGHKSLHHLILDNNWIGEAGMKPLAAIPNLTTIDLSTDRHDKAVTDAGLKELAVLKDLAVLRVSSTAITDAGLKTIGGFHGLTELALAQAPITDAGLKHLVALKSLTSLSFWNVPLTDAGLKALAAFKNLTSLSLQYHKVTDAGIKELQQALPNCKITK